MDWVRVQLLLIEEDQDFGSLLSERLVESGFVTRVVGSAEQALRSGLANQVAAVLVNLGRTSMAGARHIRPLREAGMSQPLMILSSQCQWQERVDCLDAGADDYLTKPVRAEEVAARLRAIMRRTAGSTSGCICFGDFELDLKARIVRLAGDALDLTRNEFRLLRLFILNADRVLTHRELRDRLYSEPSERSLNAIEVYIARLRQKIGKQRIRTIRGIGYKFGDPDLAENAGSPACEAIELDAAAWFPVI